MVYATSQDLEPCLAADQLVLLADDDGDGVADAAVLDRALSDGSSEIDQALGRRYVTPVVDPPGILARWCVDLAIWRLFQRRNEAPSQPQTEAVALTRRALSAIADGLAGLAGAQPRLDAYAADNLALGIDPTFSSEELESY